ncbi:MAG: hypothetical protein JNK09_00280 [Prolixibacteraceae bacterium]|nr:hypothetical protein [Prolixibacteraceae bacterium]
MLRSLKHITSILLLAVFLWPSVVKLEHHHSHCEEHSCCGSSFDTEHEKCEVCNFEFSVFTDQVVDLCLPSVRLVGTDVILPVSGKYSGQSNYSFLLRGPPLRFFAG